jgi:very-short-patch-repair endonuclease
MKETQVPGYTYRVCRNLRKRQTDSEKLLWQCLRKKRLKGLKFRRQHPIGRYLADFYCPEAHLAVELEGSIHRAKDQKGYDKIRQEAIQMRGIRVVRVRNEEVERDLDGVIRRVLSLTSPP